MNCDFEVLWTLVQQASEPGTESETVTRHVQNCERCQSELVRIGGDPEEWTDCKVWLSDVDIAIAGSEGDFPHGSDLSRAFVPKAMGIDAAIDDVDVSFLDPPSHPEMLGRIGRYDVEGVLGRGGMGVVLKAYDTELHRPVAVKVMGPEWAASPVARERFAREAQAAASVAHENVIPIFNVDSTARLPFIVMRLINGHTLAEWVTPQTPMDTATILRVAGQLADGLAAAHRRGLVHRDVKPGNILVGENRARIWITDFGLARAADSATLTRTGVIAGTPHYMSPEQARGEPLDHRSDLYSLGSVLFFMCVGRPPMQAENTLAVLHKIVHHKPTCLAELRADLPPTFVRLVASLLSMNAVDRPEDCASITKTLESAHAELKKKVYAKPSSGRRLFAGRAMVPLGIAAAAIIMLGTYAVPESLFRWATSAPTKSRPEFTTSAGQTREIADERVAAVPPVSPYIVAATASILNMTVDDQVKSGRAIMQAANRVGRIEDESLPLTKPSLDFDLDGWDSRVRACKRLLKSLESR